MKTLSRRMLFGLPLALPAVVAGVAQLPFTQKAAAMGATLPTGHIPVKWRKTGPWKAFKVVVFDEEHSAKHPSPYQLARTLGIPWRVTDDLQTLVDRLTKENEQLRADIDRLVHLHSTRPTEAELAATLGLPT